MRASTGGTVTLGEVSLVIPPDSLVEDTTIAIAPVDDTPVAIESDGLVVSGHAFEFSPPGTQFALAKPALLSMPYDAAALAAAGLDGRTLQLGYYDEALGRYFSVGGEVDPATGRLVARVEHFTLYVAMAQTLVPGNNAPTIALQSPIPAAIRAGAPVYLRATIRDYDVGGAVAGADLYYKNSPDPSVPFTRVAMNPETTLDTFGATIPANAFGSGNTTDLVYYVQAVDALGASRVSSTVAVDVVRTFTSGTLALGPATPAIAAGFERTFTFTGKDDLNASFALVPETATATNGIGLASAGATGVTFRARTVGTGAITAGFGAETASLPITVFNGALDRVAILDRFGMPLPETLVMTESETVQLDALGYDAYGNTILVTPTWATELGHVTSAGLVDTLDADGSGRVTATVGNVTGQQWLYATARSFTTTGVLGDPGAHTYNEHVAIAGETPYVVSLDDNTLRVRHRTNGVWVDDGGPVTEFVPTAARIAASTSRVQIAWIEGAPDGNRMRTAQLLDGTWQVSPETFVVDPDDGYVDQVDLAVTGNDVYIAYRQYRANNYLSVHVKRWDGASWQLLGGRVDSEGAGSMPSLAFVGGIPHVAYQHEASPFQVYVRRWIGGSWQRLGDALNVYTDYHAYRPQLIDSRGRPVVAFRQENLSTGSGSGLYPVYIRNGMAPRGPRSIRAASSAPATATRSRRRGRSRRAVTRSTSRGSRPHRARPCAVA